MVDVGNLDTYLGLLQPLFIMVEVVNLQEKITDLMATMIRTD